jgi:hypothetical protein
MELDDVIKLGDDIMSDSANLISETGAAQQAFEAVVDVGGQSVRVRAVQNRVGKLHSVHIRTE